MSGELVARLSAYPKMKAAIDTLPPKLLVLSSHAPTQAVKLESANLDLERRVDLNIARIHQVRWLILYQMPHARAGWRVS